VGAVTARRLGWTLVALLVGALIGAGAGYLTRPSPEASGVPQPVAAESPSSPSNDPYAADIPFTTLEEVTEFDHYRIGNLLRTWEYVVPAGWVATRVPSGIATPPDEVPEYDELRFRPPLEPPVGGYSLRVKAIDNHKTPADEVFDKVSGMQRAYDDVDILQRTDDAVYFTLRDGNNRLRYNFFRWFAWNDDLDATLEVSVAGRLQDEQGLRSLLDRFSGQAVPIG
jgi:hypothetical protein